VWTLEDDEAIGEWDQEPNATSSYLIRVTTQAEILYCLGYGSIPGYYDNSIVRVAVVQE